MPRIAFIEPRGRRLEVAAPALIIIKRANHEIPHLAFDLETLGLSVHAT
jgi:hypothetical protein